MCQVYDTEPKAKPRTASCSGFILGFDRRLFRNINDDLFADGVCGSFHYGAYRSRVFAVTADDLSHIRVRNGYGEDDSIALLTLLYLELLGLIDDGTGHVCEKLFQLQHQAHPMMFCFFRRARTVSVG